VHRRPRLAKAAIYEEAAQKEAAQQIFTPQVLSGFMSQATPEQIMEERNGMLVVSINDEVEGMAQEMCADWTEEYTELLGPPPAEWNCPD
jgi:uncharacterized protein YgbK (DUF1537 family)